MSEVLGDEAVFAVRFRLEDRESLLGHACIVVRGQVVGDFEEPCILRTIQGMLEEKADKRQELEDRDLQQLSDDALMQRVFPDDDEEEDEDEGDDTEDDEDFSEHTFCCEGFDDFLLVFVNQGNDLRIAWKLVESPSEEWPYAPGTVYSGVVPFDTYRRVVLEFGARLAPPPDEDEERALDS